MTTIDPIAILASLGLHRPSLVMPVAGGADAKIWKIEHDQTVLALRVLQPNQGTQAARERAAMSVASAAGIPVPRIVNSDRWQGYPVILLEWANGEPLARTLMDHAGDLELAERLGNRFGEVQAAIHRLTPPPGLRTDWITWPTANQELIEGFDSVDLNESVLIHLDYHPLNVLVEGGQITAVLDWANAHAGDPRADLARTLSIIQLGPVPSHLDAVDVSNARAVFERGWRSGYESADGSFDGVAPFCRWAGCAMEHEFAPRVGRPDLPWLTPDHLDRVRRWTTGWR